MDKGLTHIVNIVTRFVFLLAVLLPVAVTGDTYQLGDVAPRGAPDGQLNAADGVILRQIVIGDIVPDELEQLVGDVAPLGSPDGQLNAGDLVVQQRGILGEILLGTVTNNFPVITSTPNLNAQIGTPYSYLVIATDIDGDTLSYELTQAPAGMVIDQNGSITWLPAAESSHPVTVEVRDGRGGSATQSYSVIVQAANQPPVITSSPGLVATIDTPYVYQLLVDDPESDPLSYSFVTAPLGMNVSATGLINWTPVVDGVEAVSLVVSDGNGGSDTQSFSITVTGAAAQTPTLNLLTDQTALLGQTLTVQLTGSDPNGDTLVYLAEPMPLSANMNLDSTSGIFTFTPELNQVGVFAMTFIATDGRFQAQQTINITVPSPPGVTQLRGQVLTTNDAPLPGVRLEAGGVETTSDTNGDFFLDNLPVSGAVRLLVDGSTVNPALGTFATVPETITVIPGAENFLTPAIYLLPLDIVSADPVDPVQTSIITSSRVITGLEISEPVTMTIPPGAAIDDVTGLPYVGDINISMVTDPTKGPRPLPEEFDLSVYIAIQPFGVTYPVPVPISFPNLEGFPPGTRMDFFALNHDTGVMEKIGEGLVSADGKTVDSIGGVVKANSWHGIVPQGPSVSGDGTPGQTNPPGTGTDTDTNTDTGPGNEDCSACSVNKETGNLKEWHNLPKYFSLQQQRVIRLEYNSSNANPSPIIPIISGFGNQAPAPLLMSTRLNVGGVEQGKEIFSEVNVTPSSIAGQFKTTRPAIQFDGREMLTGLYDYDLVVNCYFPISRRASTLPGQVLVQNQSQSAFGAGWTIAGVQRVYESASGSVMLTEGTATSLAYTPIDATQFTSPAGDFSTLTRQMDGTLERRMKDGTLYRFDVNGLMIEGIDRNNNSTTYQYDGAQRLIEIIDPVGESFVLAYVNGKLASISDPLNRTTQFEHDSEGNLTAIIEPNGDRRTFEYNPGNNLLAAQTDQRTNRTQYFYDFAGRVKEAILPDGSSTNYTAGMVKGLPNPTPVGNPGDGSREFPTPAPLLKEDVNNEHIDNNGNPTIVESDGRTIPVKIVDSVGRTTLYTRDVDSNATQTTRPNASVIQRTFDDRGNTLTRRELFNNALYTYTYDTFSLITSFTNPNNHTTTYNRDANGNVETLVNHLGHTTTKEYDTRGLITRLVSPNLLESVYTYNLQGLVETITETPPVGSPGNVRLTQYSYDAAGQLIQAITPDGITLTLDYDLKGRLIKVTDNLNQAIEYTYDGFNNVTKTDTKSSDASLALSVQQIFDNRNRLEETRLPHVGAIDSIKQRTLDNNSNITGLVDPNGNSSSNQYDAEDRLTENTHRLNGITTYEYDTNDRVTKVTAPNGVVTEYTYDVLGRRLSESSADRGLITYTYDQNDNVLTMVDGRGITTTMVYDELERISSKTYPNTISGKIENVSYSYDTCAFGVGKLCQRNDESAVWQYEYDAFGNMVQQVRDELGVIYTTGYQYDDGDNIVQIQYPSGRVVDYSRDGVRRIELVQTDINSVNTDIVSGIQYRGDNKMTQCTFGNGLIDTRSYDLQGRLLTQTLSAIDSRTYDYDKNSNMLSRITTPQTSAYQYDALDRLIDDVIDGAASFVYDYDLNHNRQSKNKNASLATGYGYDFDSNRLSSESITSVAPLPPVVNDRVLLYNDANRLYQVVDNGEVIAEYTYNGKGERSRKTLFSSGVPQSITLYHYDSRGYLIAETSDTGVAQRDYLWAENMVPMAQIDINAGVDTLHYLHTDHLMTPRFATNQSQQINWRWEGEAFGETAAQDTMLTVNLRYPGQYYDAETGKHYNYFRYYNPGNGRFITSDPIGLLGGINSYSYVRNNSLRHIDPSGLLDVIGGPDIGGDPVNVTFGGVGTGLPETTIVFDPQGPNEITILPDIPGTLTIDPSLDGFEIEYVGDNIRITFESEGGNIYGQCQIRF